MGILENKVWYWHNVHQINYLKKFTKVIFNGLKILLGILVLLYILVFAYVSINKRSIIRQVNEEISKKLNGKVSIGDMELSFFRNFPSLSVLLHDVSIRDSMYEQHHHTFFQAERIFVRLSILNIIQKRSPLSGLTIEKGQVYLYTDSIGYTNAYLFKQKKDSLTTAAGKGKNELRSLLLKDMKIVIDDRKREKLHDLFVNKIDLSLDDDDNRTLFDTKANVIIHGLGFNLSRGSFVKEKIFTGEFEMRYDKRLKQLQFDSIPFNLSGQKFNITAFFELTSEAPQFSLRAHTHEISYETAKSLLTERITKSLSLVALDKLVSVDASFSGPLKGGDPLINVNWIAKNTQLKTPFLDFDNASFTGYFTNEVIKGLPRNDPNSKLGLNKFSAEWHEMPLSSGNIEIMNLYEPVMTCDLTSDFSLTKLNNLIESDALQLTSGSGSVNITYKGPIERNSNTNSFINGAVSFKNGNVLYVTRNVEMKNVNGKLLIRNSDVLVENLQCSVLNNAIVMQGEAKNLLTLINTDPAKASINWSIYSPSLNLGAFTFLLKPGRKVAHSTNSKSKLISMASKIDAVLEQASLRVKLNAASLVYKKFEATNVNADVSLLEDRYIINNVSMIHSGGSINMNGSLLKQKNNYLAAKLNASLDNVDVNRVFNAFNNFGQTGITAENLEGKLTATIDASLALDDNGKVYPSSVQSIIDFSLTNGGLNNYDPLKRLQKIVFKKRDLENIRFAELKDRLDINNGDIKINRMEIQSTAFSFFVEGTYSMKGNTDLSIQVPLNNLKKRRADYNPENIGTDKKGGTSIYLRGRPGDDGNVNFKIDLFNKYKKVKN